MNDAGIADLAARSGLALGVLEGEGIRRGEGGSGGGSIRDQSRESKNGESEATSKTSHGAIVSDDVNGVNALLEKADLRVAPSVDWGRMGEAGGEVH